MQGLVLAEGADCQAQAHSNPRTQKSECRLPVDLTHLQSQEVLGIFADVV